MCAKAKSKKTVRRALKSTAVHPVCARVKRWIVQKSGDDREDELLNDVADDAALLDDDVFAEELVDPEDLATGFDTTIAAEEVDVDEDTEGDDVSDAGGDEPMTMTEVANPTPRIHGDEVELDLDEALRTGRTVGEAPEEE